MCALLRSSRERVVYEASCALSFISNSHDQHKLLIVANNGCVIIFYQIKVMMQYINRLDDMFYPIEHGCTVKIAELLSGILLDLCLNIDSRHVIADHPKIGKFVLVIQSCDPML